MIEDKKGHPLEKLRAVIGVDGKPMSWYYMAKQLGIHHLTIRNIRKGITGTPSPETMAKIHALEKEVGV